MLRATQIIPDTIRGATVSPNDVWERKGVNQSVTWHFLETFFCKTKNGPATVSPNDVLEKGVNQSVTWHFLETFCTKLHFKKHWKSYFLFVFVLVRNNISVCHTEIGCQFHQRSMSSYCVRRSQKEQKRLTTWLSFCAFGIFICKCCL